MFTLTAQDRHGIVVNEVKQVGNLVDNPGGFENTQRGRVYDPIGISPSLNTVGGGAD